MRFLRELCLADNFLKVRHNTGQLPGFNSMRAWCRSRQGSAANAQGPRVAEFDRQRHNAPLAGFERVLNVHNNGNLALQWTNTFRNFCRIPSCEWHGLCRAATTP
jgi:hypothetical protein